MTNIYSQDFIKKMIDDDNSDIVHLVTQLPFIDADWMLEYAIKKKNSKIAKKLFIDNKIIRNKYALDLLRLMTSDVNIEDLYASIGEDSVDPFYFIFGVDTVNEQIKNSIIDAVVTDDEISSMVKIALLDICPEKKMAIKAICESNVIGDSAIKNTSFEFDKITGGVKIVIEL